MEFQAAMRELKRQIFHPVYTLIGTEEYLKRQFLRAIQYQMNEQEETDIVRLDLNEVALDAVLDEAETFSFFTDRKLLIVENSLFVTPKNPNPIEDHEQKRLLDYLNAPNSSTTIIFCVPYDQLDKRKKIGKAFLIDTQLVDISQLKEQAVRQYVLNYLQNAPFKITRDGVEALLVRTDFHLTHTMNELEKIETFATDRKEAISKGEINKLVPRSLEGDIFELTNAMVKRRVSRAVQIYRDLLLLGNEPIALHGLIVSQFRIIIQAKILSRQGEHEAQISKKLSVHPYRVKMALQIGAGMPLDQLLNYYDRLAEVDYQMKTGYGLRDNHFYVLLTQLMHI